MKKIVLIAIVAVALLSGCKTNGNLANYLVGKVVTFFVGNSGNRTVEKSSVVSNEIINSVIQKDTTQPATEEDTVNLDSLLKGVKLPFKVERYSFKSAKKRDIFEPLLSKTKGTESLNLDNAVLTGIIDGPNGRVALVKEFGGQGYVLKENDKIADGYVKKIGDDYIIFETHQFGIVSEMKFKLQSENQKLKF